MRDVNSLIKAEDHPDASLQCSRGLCSLTLSLRALDANTVFQTLGVASGYDEKGSAS